MLDKSCNLKKIYKRNIITYCLILLLKAKTYAKSLKITQIVMKIFNKNDRSVVYVTNFLYHDNNKPISQVENTKREL